MIEPIRLAFEVECPPHHAFRVWTEHIGIWWPADHTVTGEAHVEVVLEPFVGGRIFERTRVGDEYEWGEVTAWDPPRRLAYLWHLRRDRTDATEVEIEFRDHGANTLVAIIHKGWEKLGSDGVAWRDRNLGGWSTLLPYYRAFIEAPSSSMK
jgi:uncharacterized protein YndB with AHSA1/START domain